MARPLARPRSAGQLGLLLVVSLLGIGALLALLAWAYFSIQLCPDGTYQDGWRCIAKPTDGKPDWSTLQATAPTYVINIQRTRHRYAPTLARLQEAGFQNVHRFEGVDGKHAHLPTEWAKHYPHCVYFRGGPNGSFGNVSRQGCMLSWLNLLQRIATGPDPWVFAFEDDVVFRARWATLAPTYYEMTPNDAECVYLGFNSGRVVGTSKIVRTPSLATHAFLFTRDGARKLYTMLTTAPTVYAIDEMLQDQWWAHSLIELSGASPPLAYYCWNYREHLSRTFDIKGLVDQDMTFGSSIKPLKGLK